MRSSLPFIHKEEFLQKGNTIKKFLFVALIALSTVFSGQAQQAGYNWELQTVGLDAQWNSITFGNNTFVAVSLTGNYVVTSTDGVNWTMRNSGTTNGWRSVTYGNGLFVAVASTGTGNRVMTSPDGINWTSRTSAADNSWQSVTYGNGLFVAVATSGTGNRVMTSPDGITWTSTTSAADNNWNSVAFGDNLFVAVASSGTGNRVMTSPDGITWTSRTSAEENDWTSVTYGNGLFVAVASTGTGNRVMTSPNGITWTSRTSGDFNWSSVAFGDNLFVAIAGNGTGDQSMISSDGITWTSLNTPINNFWSSVTYGDNKFVAVSQTGGVSSVMILNSIPSCTPPSAPTASAQSFCGSATVANLVATGSNLKWYNVSSGGTALTSSTALSTGTYYVSQTVDDCESERTSVSVTVSANPNASIAVTETSGNTNNDGTICNGASATLTASGGTAYTWSTGETTAELTQNPTTTTTYTVTVTKANGCKANNNQTLTVNALPTPSVSVAETSGTANDDGNICAEATAVITATRGTAYAWSSGENTASITINPSATTTYTVTVTDANGCSASTSQSLNIDPLAVPTITMQPVAVTQCASTNATFTVEATSSENITYQWLKDGINIEDANDATLTLNTLVANDAANYSVDVIGLCGTVPSTSVALVVNPLTVITTQPTALTQCFGTNANFNVVATGTGTLTYQWKKNNTNIAGATNASLNYPNVLTSDAGSYTLEVVGGCGILTSNAAVLVVNPIPATPVIAETPALPICSGTEYLNFGAAPAGVTYQWTSSNGVVDAQVSTSQYAIVSFPNAGNVEVVLTATQDGCSASASVNVTVQNQTSHTAQVSYFANNLVCNANLVTDYQWGYDDYPTLKGNVFNGEVNQNYYNPALELDTKKYWVISTKDNCYQKTYYNSVLSNEPIVLENSKISVYPNPFNSNITISSEMSIDNATIELTGLSGELIETFKATSTETHLNLSNLPSGLYFLNVKKENGQNSIIKIIKN